MTPTLAQVQGWFDDFNRTVFGNTLPKPPITFTNNRTQLGQFYWRDYTKIGIKISLYWDRDEDAYRNTLLHEMCHLYCWHMGLYREGHMGKWKEIAKYATRVTGLDITRTTDCTGWKPTPRNQGKESSVISKRNAPAIIVDYEYSDRHFIIKTSKKVIRDSADANWNLRLGIANSVKVYICSSRKFATFQSSRSLQRGYEYKNGEYERFIVPHLKTGVEVKDLRKLFLGDYDRLGIR